MTDFYNKEEYTFDDIHSLIDNEVEESIHLDYKEANALEKSDGKKKEISKDVSAFANSDGGIIIYGLKEVNHKAVSSTYIDGNIFTKEWLEQTINSSIQRRISDLKIFPLRNNGNIEESIYVVKIPKSYDAPHMCKDKRFYKRFNFESVMMEEYEIRQLYGQKLKSKLIIDNYSLTPESLTEDEKKFRHLIKEIKITFEVVIANVGDVPESNFKVNVYFNDFQNSCDISWERHLLNYNYTWLGNGRIKISADSKGFIYPDEVVNAIRFTINVPIDKIQEIFNKITFEVGLHYNNEKELLKGQLNDYIPKILEFIST